MQFGGQAPVPQGPAPELGSTPRTCLERATGIGSPRLRESGALG